MTPIKILEQATENMIREFKEIYKEVTKARPVIIRMREPSYDDENLMRTIEKTADEIIPALELLQKDIEKWKRNRTES